VSHFGDRTFKEFIDRKAVARFSAQLGAEDLDVTGSVDECTERVEPAAFRDPLLCELLAQAQEGGQRVDGYRLHL
jgi:hypothetical protein